MSEHSTSSDTAQDRVRYACPPWCGATADHPSEDEPLHGKIIGEGEGWTVNLRQAPRQRAIVELDTPGSDREDTGEFSTAAARSIAAALVRAADVAEFELPI